MAISVFDLRVFGTCAREAQRLGGDAAAAHGAWSSLRRNGGGTANAALLMSYFFAENKPGTASSATEERTPQPGPRLLRDCATASETLCCHFRRRSCPESFAYDLSSKRVIVGELGRGRTSVEYRRSRPFRIRS